jgi:hypothetical protein
MSNDLDKYKAENIENFWPKLIAGIIAAPFFLGAVILFVWFVVS